MSNPKLTGFLIGFVLVTLFASIIGLYLSNISEKYESTTQSYDNTKLEKYSSKLSDIRNQTEQIRDATNVDAQSGWTDILGGYFKSAYNAVRISFSSFGLFNDMVEDSIDDAGGNDLSVIISPIKTALTTILLILVFVGIFIAIMVKWDTI